MSEVIDDLEDCGLLSPFDAQIIGYKIVEMADRVKATSPALPGVKAEWTFKMDGEEYRVIVSREKTT